MYNSKLYQQVGVGRNPRQRGGDRAVHTLRNGARHRYSGIHGGRRSHRVFLGVRCRHAFVAGSEERVLHVALKHHVHAPLYHVVHVALPPHAPDADSGLAMLVSPKLGHGEV